MSGFAATVIRGVHDIVEEEQRCKASPADDEGMSRSLEFGAHKHWNIVQDSAGRIWSVVVFSDLLSVQNERETRQGVDVWDGVRYDVVDVYRVACEGHRDVGAVPSAPMCSFVPR